MFIIECFMFIISIIVYIYAHKKPMYKNTKFRMLRIDRHYCIQFKNHPLCFWSYVCGKNNKDKMWFSSEVDVANYIISHISRLTVTPPIIKNIKIKVDNETNINDM